MFKRLLSLVFAFFVMTTYALAQSGSVRGTVTDSNSGEVLPGTNVFIQQLQRGASTDANGEFLIENVPSGTYTLRVSFIGYQDYTQQIQVGSSTLNLDIALQPANIGLDELVVVGFGTTSKRNLTGSVSKLSSESLEEVHLTTFEAGLQGKTAGVQVTSTSGVLGAPVSVRVRGTTSINASSQPLYVVDGVPLTDAGGGIGSTFGAPASSGGGTNPFLNINPDDIESIQVLKSATAAAVYGARGSNGVVLIETKSGSAGKTQINVGTSIGFSEPTEEYDVMTGQQFQTMVNYAIDQLPSTSQPVFRGLFGFDPNEVPNTSWTDLVTRTGTVQNYNASVSGGNAETQFYISGKFSSEEGYARPNNLDKFSALAKIDHTFNENLDVGLSINPSRSENFRVATSNAVAAPYTYAALQAPNIPQFYPNGELNDATDDSRAPTNVFSAFAGTPYSNVLGYDVLQTVTQINTTAYTDYSFTDNVSFKTDFSVQYLQVEEEQKTADFATDGFPNGSGDASNEQILNYNWNNTITYTNSWEDHSLTAVAGITFQKEESTSISLAGDTFLSNQLKNLDSAANITFGGGEATSFAFQNNLARINYQYKDRYLLTLTGSYNGSSRFGEDKQYGFFPAASAGWIISDESFMEDLDAISFLKLRAGYGVIGNADIGNFENIALLGAGADYNSQPGIVLDQLANPELKWERTQQFDAAIEFGFIENRIEGSFGYYNKFTTDLLLGVPISGTNGFTSFTQNVGEIQNTGFEFEISADILTEGDLAWSVNANVSTVENEVKKLPEGQDINFGASLVREGEPLGSFFLVEFAGVDPENGDALFRDLEGNLTDEFSQNNRKVLGDPFPDFFGGFGTNLAYKGLDLNVNFQFSQGNDIFWSDGRFLETNLSSIFNQSTTQLDYWTPENTDASVPEPRFLTSNGNQTSSRYLEDGSYLRLKSATLGYTIPKEWVNGYSFRVYAQGTNLLTFDSFPGLDPEVTPTSTANATQGNVFFQPPQQRTILFGVKLGF